MGPRNMSLLWITRQCPLVQGLHTMNRLERNFAYCISLYVLTGLVDNFSLEKVGQWSFKLIYVTVRILPRQQAFEQRVHATRLKTSALFSRNTMLEGEVSYHSEIPL